MDLNPTLYEALKIGGNVCLAIGSAQWSND